MLRHRTIFLDKQKVSIFCFASGGYAFGDPSLQGGIRRCAWAVGIRSARARPTPRPWRLMRTECHAAFRAPLRALRFARALDCYAICAASLRKLRFLRRMNLPSESIRFLRHIYHGRATDRERAADGLAYGLLTGGGSPDRIAAISSKRKSEV